MRARLPLLILLATAGACAPAADLAPAASPRPPSPSAPAGEARPALPRVALTGLDHRPTPLGDVVNGRVALVSLWATWCDSCEREFDALNRLDDRARARGAVVVGIAVGEAAGGVADFARRRGLRYAQLADEDFRFADALGQRRVPATLVVNRKGDVVFVGDALDGAALEAFRHALDAAP